MANEVIEEVSFIGAYERLNVRLDLAHRPRGLFRRSRSHIWCRFEFHNVSSQRSLPVPRVGQRFHSFAQFFEEITRRTTLRLGFH